MICMKRCYMVRKMATAQLCHVPRWFILLHISDPAACDVIRGCFKDHECNTTMLVAFFDTIGVWLFVAPILIDSPAHKRLAPLTAT